MHHRRLRTIVLASQALSLLFFPAATRADALEDAVKSLAEQVMPMLAPSKPECVDWQNENAVSDTRSMGLRSLFMAELGMKDAGGANQGDCGVEFAISRTPTAIVLVARTGPGDDSPVLISEVAREDDSTTGSPAVSVQMEKELLLQQSERILDAIELKGADGAGDSLVVLTENAVELFTSQGGGWTLGKTQALPNGGEVQRAPRGELWVNANAPGILQIQLPGRICSMNLSQSSPIACQTAATDLWRGEMLVPPPCDAGAWGLRTDSGDWSQPDRILLVNPSLPATQTPIASIHLPGPVLSLAAGSTPGVFSATVFNLTTGNYEIYRVTVQCRN